MWDKFLVAVVAVFAAMVGVFIYGAITNQLVVIDILIFAAAVIAGFAAIGFLVNVIHKHAKEFGGQNTTALLIAWFAFCILGSTIVSLVSGPTVSKIAGVSALPLALGLPLFLVRHTIIEDFRTN
ncbi:MAG: hypothetical protein U1D32_01485, partial [Patescibacteria group bacterium]|nr:hypothetical protein [Patescibacteria group bacterium]